MKFNLTASFIHLPFFAVSYVALLVLLQDQRWKIQEEATCLQTKFTHREISFSTDKQLKQAYQLVAKDRFIKADETTI